MLSTPRVIKSRRARWAKHVAHMEYKRGAHRNLVASPLGRPKCRWEDIIKDLQEVGWGGIEWIALNQHRDRWWELVTTVMNLRVPQIS